MFHVENSLTVKGLTFTRGTSDRAEDGTLYTDYSVTRDSRFDVDPEIARMTIYANGYVIMWEGTQHNRTSANCKATTELATALRESDLDISPFSSPRFRV